MTMEELKVTILQNELHWENTEANLAQFEEQIWAHATPADLIVLPETFTTGFSMNPKLLAEPRHTKTYRWMQQQAEQHKAVVCGSYLVNDGGKYFNRFYAVYPDGSSVQYDKRHLFELGGEADPIVPGDQRVIFEVKGWKIHPMICYDLRFPVWARQQKVASGFEYDVLIYIANWPKPRINAWDTLLQARAIENISYSVGVNRIGEDGVGASYIGHSNVYDYLGQPMVEENEGVFASTVSLDYEMLNKFRTRFPFNNEADRFTID
jgi:omega-amidase